MGTKVTTAVRDWFTDEQWADLRAQGLSYTAPNEAILPAGVDAKRAREVPFRAEAVVNSLNETEIAEELVQVAVLLAATSNMSEQCSLGVHIYATAARIARNERNARNAADNALAKSDRRAVKDAGKTDRLANTAQEAVARVAKAKGASDLAAKYAAARTAAATYMAAGNLEAADEQDAKADAIRAEMKAEAAAKAAA